MSEHEDIKRRVYEDQLAVMLRLITANKEARPAIYIGVMTALVQVLWADRVRDVVGTPEEFMAKLWGAVGRQCLDTVLEMERLGATEAALPKPTTDKVGSA